MTEEEQKYWRKQKNKDEFLWAMLVLFPFWIWPFGGLIVFILALCGGLK